MPVIVISIVVRRMEQFVVGSLVGFYGISTLVSYLTPNANSQLYFKQLSLALVHNLIVKTVLIQLIQFSIRTDTV